MGNSQPRSRGIRKKRGNIELKEHSYEDSEMVKEAVEKLKTSEKKKTTTQVLTDDEVKTKVHSTSAANYLYKYLLFALDDVAKDDVIKTVHSFGKVVTFLEGEYMLRAGEDSQGIFILLEGAVEVLVTDNTLAVANLSTGDVFGEISTIFGVQCTANIKVKTDVTAVVIEPDNAFGLFEEHGGSLDIIDWCVKHRYFPLGKEIDMTRTYRRMTLQILKQTPALNFWKEESLKNLILSVNRGLVTLYPPNSTIIEAGDYIHSLWIVTRGTIRISGKGGFSKGIVVSKDNIPFVYGHFCMGLGGHSANVTIQAVTNCQVIEVDKIGIVSAAHKEKTITQTRSAPRTFPSFKNTLPYCKADYAPYFEYDLLYHYVRTSEMYKNANVIDIQWRILRSVSEQCDDGSIVMLGVEKYKYEAVLVLHGTVVLQKVANKDLTNGKVAKNETEINDKKKEGDKANGDTERASLESGLNEMVFNQESVIDITRLDFSQVTLKAKGKTFVCKLPKEAVNDNQSDPPKRVAFGSNTFEDIDDLDNSVEKIGIKDDSLVGEENAHNGEVVRPVDDEKLEKYLVGKVEDVVNPKEDEKESISKQNNEDNKSDKPADSMVDKEKTIPNDAKNTEGENVKLRKSEDPLNKLNERIKKGDKIAKIATEKVDKKRSKIPKKRANELDFV